MTTNPGWDGRAAGRGVDGTVMVAQREREGGELMWFVAAILVVAAFFLLGFNDRMPRGTQAEHVGAGIDIPFVGSIGWPFSPSPPG